MTTCIQLLAVVLCSCSLQDAVTSDVSATSHISTATDVSTKTDIMATSDVSTMSDVSATSEPAKYPNLAKVSDKFWKNCEEVNQASWFGKLNTRAMRNTVDDVLNSQAFWSSLRRVVRRRVLMTTNKNDADRQIRGYEITADVLTNHAAVEGLRGIVTDMYDSAVQYDPRLVQQHDSVAFQKTLQTIFNAVNCGAVTNKVKSVKKYMDAKFNPSPESLGKVFGVLKKFLNMGGTVLLTDSMVNNMFSTTSMLEEIAHSRSSVSPINAKPEPIKVIPEPIKAIPEPINVTPGPIKATPEPIKAISEPIKATTRTV